jgi:hypothetical protein
MAVKKKAPAKKATGAKKPAFGGYTISFGGCNDTLEDVFGSKAIAPSQMTKALWAYVKSNKLAGK